LEAWAALFSDLDERVARAKKAGPEDFPRAMAKLSASQLQLLASLAATTSAKQLAALQLSESSEELKVLLFAAAAAAAATAAGSGGAAGNGAAHPHGHHPAHQAAVPPSWSTCRWAAGHRLGRNHGQR
jgi:hypothetical protein